MDDVILMAVRAVGTEIEDPQDETDWKPENTEFVRGTSEMAVDG